MGHLLPATLSFFTPESGGSPNANNIDSLYKIVLVIALVIFVAVDGALSYALVKFRARKGAMPAQIRGNTRLEIGWTVGAAVILVGLAILTFLQARLDPEPAQLRRGRREPRRGKRRAVRERRPRDCPPTANR